MLDYTISNSDNGLSVTALIDGVPLIFGPDHPNTPVARELVEGQFRAQTSWDDLKVAEQLRDIHDVAGSLNSKLREVSERFSYAEGKFRFDGDVIDKPLTRHMLDRLRSGDDSWTAYARFMMRLAENPSRESRRALYRWIGDRRLTITDDGLVVGYKGVRNDGTSFHRGKGTIHRNDDGKLVTEHYESAHLPNEPGACVEFPRSEVDPDPNSSCSVGLHVGSKDFAQSFGHRLLTVLVDPAAVVMVPKDHDGEKMRVWQYHVTDIEPARAASVTTLNAPTAFSPEGYEDETPADGFGFSDELICNGCGDGDDVTDGWCEYCDTWAD